MGEKGKDVASQQALSDGRPLLVYIHVKERTHARTQASLLSLLGLALVPCADFCARLVSKGLGIREKKRKGETLRPMFSANAALLGGKSGQKGENGEGEGRKCRESGAH